MKRRDFLVGTGAAAAAEVLVAERHVRAAGAGTYSNNLPAMLPYSPEAVRRAYVDIILHHYSPGTGRVARERVRLTRP